jgi:predicted ATPase
MILEELKIEGFRSLKSVTWKPGRLNVLIGPNGGGKSNLLSALDLLRIAATGGLTKAILQMGGMTPLVWDGIAPQLRFAVVQSDGDEQAKSFDYNLELNRLGDRTGYTVGNERFSVADSGSPSPSRHVIWDRSDANAPWKAVLDSETETILAQMPPWAIGAYGSSDGAATGGIQKAMRSWSVHRDMRTDSRSEIRGASVTRHDRRVEPDGQNLVAVLHTLYTNDRDFQQFLDKAMSAAFPDDYEELAFPPEADGKTQLRVVRKHRKRADSSADLSDGTLRFLLLMTILGSPDPAPLIAIDEPETGLHPRMMSLVAEVAENAAHKSQIIFSTHSPSFLDAFDDEPPTTTIVTMEGSETVLKTISGDELKRWIDDYSLSKFVFSGEADAVL